MLVEILRRRKSTQPGRSRDPDSCSRSPHGRSFCSRRCRIGRVARQTATFLDVFRRSQKFSEVQAICPSLPASPLVGVFQAGYAEINAQFRLTGSAPVQSRRLRRSSNPEEPRSG